MRMPALNPRRPRRRSPALALALCLLLGLPSAAAASKTQESIFQSDGLLTGLGPGIQAQTLNTLKGLGVDTIHALVLWNQYAPRARSHKRPSGFHASDPNAYPAANWDKLDGLVRGAQQRGMSLLISPVGSLPLWASTCKSGSDAGRCEPKAAEWRAFVLALARRYNGTFRDVHGALVPAISRWSIWNEPNQHGWLIPQFKLIHGQRVPWTPVIMRRLVYAEISALRQHGHRNDQILMGDLAPIGASTGTLRNQNMEPVQFLNELFCLDSRGHRYRGQAARDRDCTHVKRFDVQGITHHPYTRGAGRPPFSATASSGDITLGKLSRLVLALKRAHAAGRLRSAKPPIYFDEYGFQSNPPDPIISITLAQQSRYLNESDWYSWGVPQVAGVGQFLLGDSDRLESFQTGIEFADGRLKPSYTAYQTPIWARPSGSSTVIWGQTRPAPANSTVPVMIQRDTGSGFTTVGIGFATGPRNYFQTTIRLAGGKWRLVWTLGGKAYVSREATATNKL